MSEAEIQTATVLILTGSKENFENLNFGLLQCNMSISTWFIFHKCFFMGHADFVVPTSAVEIQRNKDMCYM